ncbi:MAG: porin family protein [Rhodocyclaceae bacterium]|nr:porin family protein [Rhodocyclaceae bacterium]
MRQHLLIISSLCIATSAFAADNTFTGASVGLALGGSHNKVKFGGFINGKSASDDDGVAKLSASYGWALSSDWVLNAGAEYTLNKQKFGSTTYVSGGTQTVRFEMKDDWAVFLAPGYRIAPNSLVYGKLAYHQAKGHYNDTLPAVGDTTHNGFGYGLGYAYALNRNVEISAEYNHIDYSRESAVQSNGKPQQDMLTVGVAYRF